MKCLNLFLILMVLACGCKKEEEEMIDLDQMAFIEEEAAAQQLASEPMDSPQEILIKESASEVEPRDTL